MKRVKKIKIRGMFRASLSFAKRGRRGLMLRARAFSKKPRPIKFGALAVVVAFVAIVVAIPLAGNKTALAFSDFTQSTWDGGVGTNPSNQYSEKGNITTSTPNQVTLGTTTNVWCNTANCNSSWTLRRTIHITNINQSNTSRDNYQVPFTIAHVAGMKDDFSDLRFFDPASPSNDMSYYIRNKTDGVSASVYVKFPVLNGAAVAIEMYYGNTGASSLSDCAATMDFCDQFTGTTLDTNKWSGDASVINAFNGGAYTSGASGVVFPLQQSGAGAGTPFSVDRVNNPEAIDYTAKVTNTGDSDNSTFNQVAVGMHDPNNLNNQFNVSQYWAGGAALSDSHSLGYQNFGSSHTNVSSFPAANSFHTYRLEPTSTQARFFVDGSVSTVPNQTDDTSGQAVRPNIYFATNPNSQVQFSEYLIYKTGNSDNYYVGQEEYPGGKTGFITSPVVDMGDGVFYGNISTDYSGTGNVDLIPATSATNADTGSMFYCPPVASAVSSPMYSAGCVTKGERYFQYSLWLSEPSGGNLTIHGVTVQYVTDLTGPGVPASASAKVLPFNQTLANDGWFKDPNDLQFNWAAAQDNAGGSGLAGYCLYFGADSAGDPVSAKGLLTTAVSSSVNVSGCQYVVSGTALNLSEAAPSVGLTDGARYYLNIKTIDSAGNVSTDTPTQVAVRYDNSPPGANTVFSGPSNYVNNKILSITWFSQAPAFAGDEESGLAGIKYCITNSDIGFGGCGDSDSNWQGVNHASTVSNDPSDTIPFSNGRFSTVPADASRITTDGVNLISMYLVDNAGNTQTTGGAIPVLTSTQPPTSPQDLVASPTSSAANNFSYTWAPPATFIGNANRINYCWTINVDIAGDTGNCNWTGQGITSLAAGPYATRQGSNTLHLMARDEAGNYDVSSAVSVDFTTTTAAPGNPRNLELSDVSTRATSAWKLALSWSAPTQTTPTVDSYKILRSTDNSTFTQVGSTSSSNTSFIDSGLSQVNYWYKVIACDNANSCSVASNVVTGNPTGRFTEAAKLTADTNQPRVEDIGTRKATITWGTDRPSDSKVAFGTSSGHYSSSEIGNSTQTSNHSVPIPNLLPGTTYYYIAKWTDQDGNTGQSQERSFTTLPAPSVSEVSATNVKVDSADIGFKSQNTSQIKIYYGKSGGFGGLQTLNTSSTLSAYSVHLTGLDDGTKYFYRLNGVDSDGNEYQGDVYSFSTPARPIITNVQFQPVPGNSSGSQKISWTTNVPANSKISYGPVGGKQLEAIDSSLTTEHSLIAPNLNDDTAYTVVVSSQDATGNVATSGVLGFRTALDTTPPTVSNINVESSIIGNGSSARGQLIVSWKTDEPSTSQVAYGLGQSGAFTSRTGEDTKKTTDHVVILSDLPTSSIYHLQVVARDKANNTGYSDPQSAIVGRGSDNIFTIIFTALQKIFGIGG